MRKYIIILLLLLLTLICGFGLNADAFETDISTEEPPADTDSTDDTYADVTEPVSEYSGCDHDWSEWFIVSGPTKNNEGREMHICSLCGERETRPIKKLPDNDYKVQLDVENILQLPELPSGCEIVSLAIVLNYLGFEVDSVSLCDNYLEKCGFGEGDPFFTYIGDPKISGMGMGCYAPCIQNAARAFLDDAGDEKLRVKNISGEAFSVFESYIDKGVPVILWGTTNMDCDPTLFMTVYTDNGDVVWRSHSHCLVLIGYTANTYIFCDPLKEGITEYQKSDVRDSHELVYRQALVIYE